MGTKCRDNRIRRKRRRIKPARRRSEAIHKAKVLHSVTRCPELKYGLAFALFCVQTEQDTQPPKITWEAIRAEKRGEVFDYITKTYRSRKF